MIKFYVRFGAKFDNSENQLNRTFEKKTHLKSGKCSHMIEFYLRSGQNWTVVSTN